MTHVHAWYFTLAPGRWSATCACGLAVEVEEPDVGSSTWFWTLQSGQIPGVDVLLAGIGSVIQSRQVLLLAKAPMKN